MKKAFTLIEVLILIAVIPVFMLIMSRLFNILMQETPRIWKNIHQNTTTLNMLSQLQDDIDNARSLPQSYGEFTSSDKLLLIEQREELIGYEFDAGQITRRILNDAKSESGRERTWKLPDVNINWKVLTKNGNGYCLEITNDIEYKTYGKSESKMMNSHLYFIGAL